MDHLSEVQIFVMVAKENGLAAAARCLQCSAPTITRAIAGLENRLGVLLLHRSTQGVQLTEAGKRYLADCQRIVHHLEEAEKSAAGTHQSVSGSLTITSPMVFGQLRLMPIIQDYLKRHPSISIRAQLMDRTPNLHEEGIDVAILMGELPDSSLFAIKVGYVSRVLVAAPQYLQQYGQPQHFSELYKHSLISSLADTRTEKWQFQEDGALHEIDIQPRWQTATNTSALIAAEVGAGITRVMSYQAENAVISHRLCPILQTFAPPAIAVQVVYREGLRAAARVRSFVDFCVERLRMF